MIFWILKFCISSTTCKKEKEVTYLEPPLVTEAATGLAETLVRVVEALETIYRLVLVEVGVPEVVWPLLLFFLLEDSPTFVVPSVEAFLVVTLLRGFEAFEKRPPLSRLSPPFQLPSVLLASKWGRDEKWLDSTGCFYERKVEINAWVVKLDWKCNVSRLSNDKKKIREYCDQFLIANATFSTKICGPNKYPLINWRTNFCIKTAFANRKRGQRSRFFILSVESLLTRLSCTIHHHYTKSF